MIRENERHYPRLSLIARAILPVPASSAPSERTFSIANHILQPRRRNMNSDRVSRFIFMKANMDAWNSLEEEKAKAAAESHRLSLEASNKRKISAIESETTGPASQSSA